MYTWKKSNGCFEYSTPVAHVGTIKRPVRRAKLGVKEEIRGCLQRKGKLEL